MSIIYKKKCLSLVFFGALVLSLFSSTTQALTELTEEINEQELCANENIAEKVEKSKENYALSQDKVRGIALLAEKLEVPFDELMEMLHFKDNCYLVPLQKLDEHKECLIKIFSNSNPEYMQYYLDGKLRSPEKVEEVYLNKSLCRMWDNDKPKSLNFIIDCDNVSVGRIAIGSLYDRGKFDAEVGYALLEEYSGRGIVSEATKTLINLVKYLVEKEVYDLERIRATAKEDNIASNKILMKNNFVKSLEKVDDGYSPENEYFYYLKNQETNLVPDINLVVEEAALTDTEKTRLIQIKENVKIELNQSQI